MKKTALVLCICLLTLIGCSTDENNSNEYSNNKNSDTSTQSTASPNDTHFTVTWKNYDGTILEIDNDVAYNSIPSYDGETPTRNSDDEYKYFFQRWNQELSTVTSNQEYIAVYDKLSIFYDSLNDICHINSSSGNSVIEPHNYSQVSNYSEGNNLDYWHKDTFKCTECGNTFIQSNRIYNDVSYYNEKAYFHGLSAFVGGVFVYPNNINGFSVSETSTGLSTDRIFSKNPQVKLIYLPSTITTISPYSFVGSSVECFAINNSIKNISNNAFYGCTKLSKIYFKGTKAQWQSIQKGMYWNESGGSNHVYFTIICSDGSINSYLTY